MDSVERGFLIVAATSSVVAIIGIIMWLILK
jgi:hypothetical protein